MIEFGLEKRFGMWWAFDLTEMYVGVVYNRMACPIMALIEGEHHQVGEVQAITIRICIVPCFPIVIRLQSKPQLFEGVELQYRE